MMRLAHIAPGAVTVLAATSLSLNMADSVVTPRGMAFALAYAVMIFASILVRPLPVKYMLAAGAYSAFFLALPELSFDKLVSVDYLSLVLLAFLLPSPLPTAVAAGYTLYFTPTRYADVAPEMVRTIMIGIVVNTILYLLLAFYFRNMRRENERNVKLNAQLNEALGKLEHMAYYDSLTKLPNRECSWNG